MLFCTPVLRKTGGVNNQKPSCLFIKELGLSEEVIGKRGILFPLDQPGRLGIFE